MANAQSLLAFFRTSLRSFQASEAPLRILRTVPTIGTSRGLSPSRLLVLDASFNPPTQAHLHLATSAFQSEGARSASARLVLLLATQNADKAPQPAALEHRLCMMTLFADDVVKSLEAAGTTDVAVDIGVTKLPYFIGKAKALSNLENYDFGQSKGQPVMQIHLVGYDTLTRIFNPKYYPPKHDLSQLEDLFKHHQLRVTFRLGSDWGNQQEQLDYVEAIRDGRRDIDGAQRGWADKVTMAENQTKADGPVSSTKARAAAKAKEITALEKLCSPAVADWILKEQLYVHDE